VVVKKKKKELKDYRTPNGRAIIFDGWLKHLSVDINLYSKAGVKGMIRYLEKYLEWRWGSK
jgi:hypothetical protein